MTGAARPGWKHLSDRLTVEARESSRTARKEVTARLPRALERLGRELENDSQRVPVATPDADRTMAEATATRIEVSAKRLGRSVGWNRRPWRGASARIAGKRLRYLVEVLEDDVTTAMTSGDLDIASGPARRGTRRASTPGSGGGRAGGAGRRGRSAPSDRAARVWGGDGVFATLPSIAHWTLEIGRLARADEAAALARLLGECTTASAGHWLHDARAVARFVRAVPTVTG